MDDFLLGIPLIKDLSTNLLFEPQWNKGAASQNPLMKDFLNNQFCNLKPYAIRQRNYYYATPATRASLMYRTSLKGIAS